MIRKENKFLKYASLISGVAALIYIWFYDIYFEPNPAYGDRASTASNVGRDHWAAFIVWGLILEAAFALNVLYACDKFGTKKKFVRFCTIIFSLGCLGFVICKNEKFKRFTVNISFDQYTGNVKDPYDEQIFVSSKPLYSFFWSKKSMHSAFSVIFGVFLVLAVIYILIAKSRTSKKFVYLSAAFALYVIVAAFCLKTFLGGTAEIIAITVIMIPILIVNHTDIMLDDDAPEPIAEPAEILRES
ncbi:MAG: hypothetical protein IJU45_00070 [Clostridia bacterium]|nr:hypothetical protein [Clostridia bacterium]